MNSIIYKYPELVSWMMLGGAALIGYTLAAIIHTMIGMTIQRNREPEAWNRERAANRKYYELEGKYGAIVGKLNAVKMALGEK